jgi:CRP-like cAMP-binding protein
VFLVDFSDYTMTYEIKYYMGNHSRINETNDSVRSNVWYELKRQGITIPFPIRTLHVERKKAPPLQEDQAEAFSILRGERLFDCLSEDQLNHMVNQARLKLFGRGEPVIEEGAAGESMFVMLRGAANVFVSKNGSKIQVATLGAGDCFGEMSLLTGEPRSATVRADGDCYVMEIGKPVMAKVLSGAPTCMEQLSQLLAQRKMETEGILKEATSTDEHALTERQYTATFLHRLRTFFQL